MGESPAGGLAALGVALQDCELSRGLDGAERGWTGPDVIPAVRVFAAGSNIEGFPHSVLA